MNAIDQIPRLAMDIGAHVYIQNHMDNELLTQEFNAWCQKNFERYDPCDTARLTVSLTQMAMVDIPGWAFPQLGHVVTMIFEQPGVKVQDYKRAELFLRVSETGRIVELCQCKPTIH